LLLERSRTELSAQQYALLSGRLAETEAAYAELVAAAQAAGEVVAESGAVSTVVATGLAELLPALMIVWPSTAHAPGNKPEKPAVRAARSKLEKSTRALTEAAQQVEAEHKVATSGAGRGFTDDTECELKGSGGVSIGNKVITCRYLCDGLLVTIALRPKMKACPGDGTGKFKWKEIKGFERKP